jgi:uncharacterized surface protein with fasciclin (FAS1) repeats
MPIRCWNNWQGSIRNPFILSLLAGWLIILSVISSCKTDSDPTPWGQDNALTIGQYLNKNQQEYSKFYRLLVEARMLETLYAYNPKGSDWTLFLPTDEAIDQFIEQKTSYGNFEELVKDTTFIKRLTRYHILKKRAHTNDFPDGAFIDSTLTGERLVAGFFVMNNNQLVKINHEAPIIKANQEATNGYIQVISKVLQPLDLSGYDWLQQQPEYSILARAMELSAIKKTLAWEKYTLFVEPDSVYHLYGIHSAEELISQIATPGMALTNPANAFYKFSAYHLLKGEYYMNDFNWGNKDYSTFSGEPLTIDVGQEIKINTGVDTYVSGTSATGGLISIGYIRPAMGKSNMLTHTGPVHTISDLMYHEKLPKGIKKVF